MKPKIVVVIPTIDGREEHYARAVEAYSTRSVAEVQIRTYRNLPTCGIGWIKGAEWAEEQGFDYLHLSSDDMEPQEGWDVAAMEANDRGFIPSPRIMNAAGKQVFCGDHGMDFADWTQVHTQTIPFMNPAMLAAAKPLLPLHYFIDDWVSWMGNRAGFRTVVRRGYAFVHHYAMVGRGAGVPDRVRMKNDQVIFERALSAVRSGELK